MRKLITILLFACCAAFGQQTNTDLIPATTGLNMGHSNQRWNGYFNNIDITGTCTFNGGTCLGGGGTASNPGGSANQIQYNGGSAFAGFTLGGDCTLVVATGVVTCTKTGGVSFDALATTVPGTGVATFLATPSSANLLSALTTKTGTGNAVFGTAPAISAPVLTGTPDASGATQFKFPVGAGFATTANGNIGYDSTNLNWHVWQNAADRLMAVINGSPTTNVLSKFVLSGSTASVQNSLLTDDATTLSYSGTGGFSSTASGAGNLTLTAASGGGSTSFQAPTSTTGNAALVWTMPIVDSTGSQCLASNGSGALAWSACSAGGTVSVNGSTVSNPNFNGTTPAAAAGFVNGTFQVSSSSVSVEVPFATTSTLWLPHATTGPPPAAIASQTDAVANQVSCVQFTVPLQITPTKVVVNIQTTSAGQSAQVGIYDSSLNLIRDSGALSCTTGTGVSSTVTAFTLSPGNTYYECTAITDTTCALSGTGANVIGNIARANAIREFTCANSLAAGAMPAACGAQTSANQKKYLTLLEQ